MQGKIFFLWPNVVQLNLLCLSLFLFTVDVYPPEFFQLFITQYSTNKDNLLKNPEILLFGYHFIYSHTPHTVTSVY